MAPILQQYPVGSIGRKRSFSASVLPSRSFVDMHLPQHHEDTLGMRPRPSRFVKQLFGVTIGVDRLGFVPDSWLHFANEASDSASTFRIGSLFYCFKAEHSSSSRIQLKAWRSVRRPFHTFCRCQEDANLPSSSNAEEVSSSKIVIERLFGISCLKLCHRGSRDRSFLGNLGNRALCGSLPRCELAVATFSNWPSANQHASF